jgi:hypothetical protein
MPRRNEHFQLIKGVIVVTLLVLKVAICTQTIDANDTSNMRVCYTLRIQNSNQIHP